MLRNSQPDKQVKDERQLCYNLLIMRPHTSFADVSAAIEEIRAGRMIVVVDDEDRENEGDLTLAAEKVTPEAINFMAKYGRGLVCLAMTEERLDHLRLGPMSAENTSQYGTAFCEAIDARVGVTTGISAYDRARTIQVAIDPATKARIWRGRDMCFRCARERVECWCGRDRPRLRWIWRGWQE